MINLEELSKSLAIDDIEFRIGSVQKTYGKELPKGFSLLAYKTARVDVKRLNDVAGLNWKNRYFYDDKGILCCEISIYNSEIGDWVSRVDVGTESNTEKEKGSYSDAFKRAGFKWGIGTELYNMPFIWINWNDYNEYQGKYTPRNFDAKSIKIEEYLCENAEVKKLKLIHKGTVIYEFGKNIVAPAIEKPKAPIQVQPIKIKEDDVLELESLISQTNSDKSKFLEHFKISKIEDMTIDNFVTAKVMLEKKLK